MSSVNQVGMSGIVSLTEGAIPKDTAKITQAAQQFEAPADGWAATILQAPAPPISPKSNWPTPSPNRAASGWPR